MKKNEPIRNIMTATPIAVHTAQSPSEAREVLSKNNVHHVPVVQGEKLVGILSSTDFLRLSFVSYGSNERAFDAWLDHTYTIQDIMQGEVTTLNTNDRVQDAARLLAKANFHSIPIVDNNQNLQGIVTSSDLIQYLVDQY